MIHVDFKSLKFKTFEELFVKFKSLISKLYIEKEYYKDLKLDGVEKIEEYAIVFCEKSCIVR